MSPSIGIAALWLLFAATHVGLSSRSVRPRLVAVLGERGFLGAYSVVALALFVPLCWLYFSHRHAGALLWTPLVTSRAVLGAVYAGQVVAWTMIVAGNVSPTPAALGVPAARKPKEARGIHRITRHPTFMGVGLFGVLHLLVMGFASDVAFWAGLPLFALVGCAHQDARKLATLGPDYRSWHAGTAFLPFTGRNAVRGLREIPTFVYVVGLATTVLLRWLHGPVFH